MAQVQDETGNPILANVVASGTFTLVNDEALVTIFGQAVAAVQVSSLAGVITIVFEGSVDGVNYQSITGIRLADGVVGTSTAANGLWVFSIGAYTKFRARCSAVAGGSALVSVKAGQGSGGLPFGGEVTLPDDAVVEVEYAPGGIDTFGTQTVAQRQNQIDIPFYRAVPASLVTVTVANGGTATSSGGGAAFTTGASANGTSKGVSVATTYYSGSAEMYAYFSARFTTPDDPDTYQRIGLYDTNNGFFVGFEGLTFGLVVRSGAVDVPVAKASWNTDTLVGAVGSRFTRNEVPEAINLTNLNLFRIRFGWLGSAPITFEAMSPDGRWVIFHQIHQPNLATTLSIQNSDLPMTIDVVKTAGGATSLTVFTGCWAAGISALTVFPEKSVDGFTASMTGTGDTLVIAAPGPGLRLYITQIIVTNGHATVGTYVNLKSAATTRQTGFARSNGGGFVLDFGIRPLRLGLNEALNAANVTTGSDTRVSANGYVGST